MQSTEATQIALLLIGLLAGLVLMGMKRRIERKAKRNHPAPPILTDRVDDWAPKGRWK